jgi:hypothetical protein
MMSEMEACAIPGEKTVSTRMLRRERGEVLIALGIFAAAVLYLWPLRDYLAFNADEGITLGNAERILRG